MKITPFVFSALLLAGAAPVAAQAVKKIPVQELIEKLGDSDYEARKAAEKALLERGEAVLDALNKSAKKHDDPEVQWRSGRLARKIQKAVKSTASKDTTAKPKVEGLAPRKGLQKRRQVAREEIQKERAQGTDKKSGQVERRGSQDRVNDILRQFERNFDGPGFGGDVRDEIDRAMKRMDKMRSRMLDMDDLFRDGGLRIQMRPGQGVQMGRSIQIQQGEDGVRVEVTETGEDGKPEKKVYKAKSMDELRKKHPEVLKQGGLDFQFGNGRTPFEGFRILQPRMRRSWRDEVPRTAPKTLRRRGSSSKTGKTGTGDANGKLKRAEAGSGRKLGFYAGDVHPAVRTYLGLQGGLQVEGIVADSLAKSIGLREGDIVLRVGKQAVADVADVAKGLADLGKAKVTVEVIRKGAKLTLSEK